VAKGYNIRRHLAEPGRDDTFVVDQSWRAICFSSGEARGLSVSLPEVLGQLKEIVGDRKVMVGFDRGGSYPKVFQALAEADMEWVTWRRAPLVVPTVSPRRSWVEVDGHRHTVLVADEVIDLQGYEAGPVRQLSAYENGRVAFQVLTSSHDARGAVIVHRLRSRWCIENTNKYLEDHQGVHWLCTYEMDVEENTAKVANLVRRAAKAKLRDAEAALALAERALGRQATRRTGTMDEHLAAIGVLQDHVAMANDDLEEARYGLKGIPAKLFANELDPTPSGPSPASLHGHCRWCAACSPTTPSWTLPVTSTHIWPTTTSTSDHPQPVAPRGPDRLRPPAGHRHLGQAELPPGGKGARPAPRRARCRITSPSGRRPATDRLPDGPVTSFNSS